MYPQTQSHHLGVKERKTGYSNKSIQAQKALELNKEINKKDHQLAVNKLLQQYKASTFEPYVFSVPADCR